MAKESEPIEVTSATELVSLLEMAGRAPLVLEKNGVRYRLAIEEGDIWAGYDPKKVRAALAKTSGSWPDLDAEAAVAEVYRARAQGSRPASRP